MSLSRPAGRGASSRIGGARRVAGVALLCALFVVPVSARAGEYRIDPCPAGDTTARPADSYFALAFGSSNEVGVQETCSTSGQHNQAVFFIAGNSLTGADGSAGIRFRVPTTSPNAKIVSVLGTAYVSGIAPGGSTDGAGQFNLVNDSGGALLKHIATFGEDSMSPVGPIAIDVRPSPSSRSVSLTGTCDYECPFSGLTGTGDIAAVRNLSFTLDESIKPSVTWAGTGLLAGPSSTPKSGVQTLSFSAVDEDSGLWSVGSSEYGMAAVTTKAFGVCTYRGAAACTRALPVAIDVDLSRIPPGPNRTIAVTLVDAAGNTSRVDSPPFTVAAAPAPAPTNTPVPTPTPSAIVIPTATPSVNVAPTPTPGLSLDVLPVPTTLPTPPTTPDSPNVGGIPSAPNGFTPGKVTVRDVPKAKAKPRLTKDFGDKITLTGQLVHDGKPLAGVSVDILCTVARKGAARERLATVVTDENGIYTYVLTATVSSTVLVAYPEHVGAGDYSASRSLTLGVRAGVQLGAAPGSAARGQQVKFSGTVKIDPFPDDPPRVVIQVRSAYGWQDVATLRSRTDGSFRWSHAFRSRGSFRFRARVLGQKDLGAVPSTSAPLALRIR